MGLFSGPRRVEAAPAERSLVMPDVWRQARSVDYASVNPVGEGSLQSVAVGSTVDLICSLGSELPVDVFTGEGSERRKVKTPGNLEDPAGDGTGVEDWIYQALISWLLRGNLFGFETLWDRRGRALHVDLLHPDDVSASDVDGEVQWRVKGREVTDLATFVHRRVNPMPGRVLGLSPIEKAAATVGVSLSSTQFGRQWFADGAHPGSMLVNENNLTQEQAQIAKERFLASTRGTREPVVLGKGWDYKPIQVSPNESQFLETQAWSEAQCARIFGPGFAEILGYETGGSMTYANVVDRRADLLVLGMNRWLRRVDRILTALVPPQQYVRLNRDALLEATTLQRYEAHNLALTGRWRTVNEVREIEDLPPVEWGDKPMETTPPAANLGGGPRG